ncbi:MAG: hypothetical protein LBC86_08570 [Oscillospiraceae bacterium]|jgi:hypothetical protein|nr:hypothetical protein [Oscillospiraceae bacterium]
MQQNQIPEIKIMTIKTLIFVKNPMELADTKKMLGENYEVLHENNPVDIEETVKRYIIEANQPQCHLHRWESDGWVGYHIFISL